jgi:hypothetical protein
MLTGLPFRDLPFRETPVRDGQARRPFANWMLIAAAMIALPYHRAGQVGRWHRQWRDADPQAWLADALRRVSLRPLGSIRDGPPLEPNSEPALAPRATQYKIVILH